MARGVSYGELLRDARERKGMDLPSVARRLRVRADILAAIEDADFASLPPSGYTRNMINAYARLVGADPRDMTSRYLDELHLFETGRARVTRERFDPPASTSRSDRPVRALSPSRRPSRYERTRANDRLADDRQREDSIPRGYNQPSSRYRERYGNQASSQSRYGQAPSGYGSNYHGSRSPQRTRGDAPSYGRETLRVYDSYAFQPEEPRSQRAVTRGRGLPAGEYATSPYAGLYSRRNHAQKATLGDALSAGVGAIVQRLPVVIAIIAVIVVLILIVSFIGRGDEPTADETPTMPISGLTDTSTQDSDAYNMAATETAPTSATFSFEVASGSRSWIELVVDGEDEVNQVVTGPETKEVEFKDSLSFSCGNVSPVTIKLDGKVVEPTYSSRDEQYVYTASFASILAEWQRAHPTVPTTSSSASSSSSSSASSSR